MADYKTPGVYIEEIESGSRPIVGISTSTAGMIGFTRKSPDDGEGLPILVNSFNEFRSIFGGFLSKDDNENFYLPYAVKGFFENGGERVYIKSIVSDALNDIIGDADKRTGIAAFEAVPDVNIVLFPGNTNPYVQKALIEHCEKMKNRTAILDCINEEATNISNVIEAAKSVSSEIGSYGALYFPWFKIRDQYGLNLYVSSSVNMGLDESIEIPPSGHIAGIYARNDAIRGVYKAPANEPVVGIDDLKYTVNKSQDGTLNDANVNVIRSFPGRGYLVWGARTLSPNASFRYISVRRLFNYIEQAIEEGTQWVVFEPNNEKLWARIRLTVSEFLTRVWRDGALMGSKAEEAFYVACDRTIMTQSDINAGKLVIEVGIAPTKPAEFVTVRITHWYEGMR